MNGQENRFVISRRAWFQALGAAACSAYWTNSILGSPALQEDDPALHNWMLVGSQTAFLSHLPMFEKLNATRTDYLTPHRFQVILQGSFTNSSGDVGELYFKDRTSHPEVK